MDRKIGSSVHPPPFWVQTHRRCKHTHTTPSAILDENGRVWNGEGETVWHTDFSWVAGEGNSISKTSRRLCKTLESGFLPADHRQLLHTLINHMQMSLQRHWGMIRTLPPRLHNKEKKNTSSHWGRTCFQSRVSCSDANVKILWWKANQNE